MGPVGGEGASGAAPLALVLAGPDDPDRRAGLAELAAWLGRTLGAPPLVVAWHGGVDGGVDDDAAGGPVLDVTIVNAHPVALALQRARLGALASRSKSLLLRRLLQPLDGCPRLLLDGAAALAVLDWLPPDPRRRVAALVPRGDAADLAAAGDRIDVLLPADGAVAAGLAAAGVPATSIGPLVGDPLIDVSVDAPTGRDPAPSGGLVGLAGAAATTDHELTLVAALLDTAGDGLPAAPLVARIGDDPARGWARHLDDRFTGLDALVVDWTVDEAITHLDELDVLVTAGATGRLAAAARAAGLPRADLEAGSAAALGTAVAAARTERTTGAADGPSPHRVDVAGPRVLAALGPRRP